MYLAALAMVVGGAFVVAVGRRATSGRLPRDGHGGIRTRVTTLSDDTWYPSQRIAGPWIVASGVAIAFGGAIIFVARPDDDTGLTVAASAALIAGVAALVGALLAGRVAHGVVEASPAAGDQARPDRPGESVN